MAVDPIAAAIAATEPPAAPVEVELRQFNVVISSTGRMAIIAVPPDATDAEILELGAHLNTFIVGEVRKTRGPSLVIARGSLPKIPT